MVQPLKIGDPMAAKDFSGRLQALEAKFPPLTADVIPCAFVGWMTSASAGEGDTAHILVMDVHRAINRLAAKTAVETLAGASVHGLDASDRPRMEAFMRGLNRTRHLAFGHPGLDTSATRTDGALIIENDIGETDAHVIVIRVEGTSVTITYTDVHRSRTEFFMKLLGPEVEWSTPSERRATGFSAPQFLLVTGRFQAKTGQALDEFLEALGSRLVFMIDWNKARKALRNFVPDEAAKEILYWCAMEGCGHRALLEMGGAEVIFEAVRQLAGARVPYGTRLDKALGAEKTIGFLQEAMRVTSQGLASDRSIGLLKDEVQALLASEFDTLERALFAVLVRHLGVSHMSAGLIEDAISGERLASARYRENVARQARMLEHKADRLTIEGREIATRLADAQGQARRIIDAAEDANDALQEAAFLLSLLPEQSEEAIAKPLRTLAGIAKASIGHLIQGVEAGACLPDGLQSDINDALQAANAVIEDEKKADEALRLAMAASVASARDPRFPLLEIEIARAIETCTDHLAHAAFALRDRVLNELKA
jgi:hypothetical protein